MKPLIDDIGLLSEPESVASWDYAITATIARWLVFAAIVSLPFSHMLVNQFAVGAVVFAIFSGQWREKWLMIKSCLPIGLSVCLLLLLASTMLYRQVPFADAITSFLKYTKILYIPFLLPLFLRADSRQKAVNCLIATVVLATIISIAVYLQWINLDFLRAHPWPLVFSGENGMLINIMDFSVLSAYTLYLLINSCLSRTTNFYMLSLKTVLIFLLGWHLFFINGEKTGACLFFLLMALLMWQHFKWRGVVIAIIMMPLIFAPSYLFSHKFSDKVDEFFHYFYGVPTQTMAQSASQSVETSTAYRVDFFKYSYQIFKQHPWLGTGVGGFKQAYTQFKGPLLPGTQFQREPHNSYIYILVEAGIIGFLLYLAWLVSLWVFTYRLVKPEQMLAQALVLSFAFNSLTNVGLTINTTGTLYMLFIAILFAESRSLGKTTLFGKHRSNLDHPL